MTTSLIVAAIAALASIYVSLNLFERPHEIDANPGPGQLSGYRARPRVPPNSPEARICLAHLANSAVVTARAGWDSHSVTHMIHEVLDLDVSVAPFDAVNMEKLANGDQFVDRWLTRIVMDGMFRSHAERDASVDDDREHDHEDQNMLPQERAARLSAIVLAEGGARSMYLSTVWPEADKASQKKCRNSITGTLQGKNCLQAQRVIFIDLWCEERGFSHVQ